MNRWKNIVYQHRLLIPFLILFGLMLFRNPFSIRTLIPNLEPFPDTFHYLIPAQSFISGKGFVFERGGRTFNPSVPPLYSLYLSPFLLIGQDVRIFYFANVLLAILALILFYAIVLKLFPLRIIQALLLFLYVTYPVLNWFPTLVMAENLLLVIYLAALLLLLERVCTKTIILFSVLCVWFYCTKYASLPLAVSFPLLYVLKILVEEKGRRVRSLVLFSGLLCVVGGLYEWYEYVVKGNNIVLGLFSLLRSMLFPEPLSSAKTGSTGAVYFSPIFMRKNIFAYGGWLIGREITMLWKQVSIFPPLIALSALIGIGFGMIRSKNRFIAFSIFFSQAMVILLMSVFYAYDGRYFFTAIPSLFLGFGMFVSFVLDKMEPKVGRRNVKIIVAVLLLFFALTKAKEIKYTLALNLKYAESPWYYISITRLDAYLGSHSIELKKTPVVISSLPPFLVDAYSKQPKILLPLNKGQEFRSYTKQVWGDFDFDNLDGEYERQLRAGHTVLLMKYGLGNEQYLHNDFDRLLQKFDATKVMSGCYDLCDIYELRLQKQE